MFSVTSSHWMHWPSDNGMPSPTQRMASVSPYTSKHQPLGFEDGVRHDERSIALRSNACDIFIPYRYGESSLCVNFHFPSTITALRSSSG